jgi:ribonucleotide reductase alpha subunit
MRLAINSPLVEPLKEAGYHVEPAVGSEQDNLEVEIPVDVGNGIRTINDVSMWEQVALAANMQRWWADNQVSCTVTFKPETEGSQIASVLDYFQYHLKGISFLPKCDFGAFPQMPYEEITEDRYTTMCNGIKPLQLFNETLKLEQDGEEETFCDGDKCLLKKTV